ncbi:MAG TPA: hypothetical protein VK607_00770 [Kofleriaceae bacterium]|nr:hypothetical protein [Kofleriaceae bacterium]
MTVEILSSVGPDRIELAYERLGDPAAPPVLLIMGLGAQLIGWPDGLGDALVAHDLQPALWPAFASRIAELVRTSSSSR